MGKERCLDIMKIGIHFGHWGSFYGQLGVRECLKQAKEAGCEKVYNGMSMMLFQALIAIKLYTGKDTPVDYMKEKLGI